MRTPSRAALCRTRLLLVLALAGTLILTGCADTTDSPATPSNGVADLPPEEIVNTAYGNLEGLSSVRIEVGRTDVDIQEGGIVTAGDREGTVYTRVTLEDQETIETVFHSGVAYARGDPELYEKHALTADQWLSYDLDDPALADATEFVRAPTFDDLLKGIVEGRPEGELQVAGEEEINGQPMVGVRHGDGVLWVPTTGTALPLLNRLTPDEGGIQGEIRLVDVDEPVQLPALDGALPIRELGGR